MDMELVEEFVAGIELVDVLALAWQVVAALLIFIIGRWVAGIIIRVLRKTLLGRGLDSMLCNFLTNILYVVLLVAVLISAIAYLGVPVTPAIAVLGGAALAVGLALQSSLSNFASGVMLVGFHPFGEGDFVEAGGVSGTVVKVGIFHTVLKTPDNRLVVVPNSQVTGSAITNFSAHDTRRIDLIIGVDYSDDLKAARAAIQRVLDRHEKVLDDPEPVIMLMDLGDSSVDFAVRPWVNAAEFWPVRGELLEQIKDELESAGCSIPFPQRDVHLHGEVDARKAAND